MYKTPSHFSSSTARIAPISVDSAKKSHVSGFPIWLRSTSTLLMKWKLQMHLDVSSVLTLMRRRKNLCASIVSPCTPSVIRCVREEPHVVMGIVSLSLLVSRRKSVDTTPTQMGTIRDSRVTVESDLTLVPFSPFILTHERLNGRWKGTLFSYYNNNNKIMNGWMWFYS